MTPSANILKDMAKVVVGYLMNSLEKIADCTFQFLNTNNLPPAMGLRAPLVIVFNLMSLTELTKAFATKL